MKGYLIFAIGFTVITSIPSFSASAPVSHAVTSPGVVRAIGIGTKPSISGVLPPATAVKRVDRLVVPMVPTRPMGKVSPADLTGKRTH